MIHLCKGFPVSFGSLGDLSQRPCRQDGKLLDADPADELPRREETQPEELVAWVTHFVDLRVSIVMGLPLYCWMISFMDNPNLKLG